MVFIKPNLIFQPKYCFGDAYPDGSMEVLVTQLQHRDNMGSDSFLCIQTTQVSPLPGLKLQAKLDQDM